MVRKRKPETHRHGRSSVDAFKNYTSVYAKPIRHKPNNLNIEFSNTEFPEGQELAVCVFGYVAADVNTARTNAFFALFDLRSRSATFTPPDSRCPSHTRLDAVCILHGKNYAVFLGRRTRRVRKPSPFSLAKTCCRRRT